MAGWICVWTCFPAMRLSDGASVALQALRVMDIPAAHPAKPSEQLPRSSSSGGYQRKRKRSDTGEAGRDTHTEPLPAGQSGRPAEAGAGGNGAAATSMASPDKATWDIEYPAGLKEVVRWCTEQQSWPLVQCELQASSYDLVRPPIPILYFPSHISHPLCMLGIGESACETDALDEFDHQPCAEIACCILL